MTPEGLFQNSGKGFCVHLGGRALRGLNAAWECAQRPAGVSRSIFVLLGEGEHNTDATSARAAIELEVHGGASRVRSQPPGHFIFPSLLHHHIPAILRHQLSPLMEAPFLLHPLPRGTEEVCSRSPARPTGQRDASGTSRKLPDGRFAQRFPPQAGAAKPIYSSKPIPLKRSHTPGSVRFAKLSAMGYYPAGNKVRNITPVTEERMCTARPPGTRCPRLFQIEHFDLL